MTKHNPDRDAKVFITLFDNHDSLGHAIILVGDKPTVLKLHNLTEAGLIFLLNSLVMMLEMKQRDALPENQPNFKPEF